MSDKEKVESFFERFGASKLVVTPPEASVHDIRRKKPYVAAEIEQGSDRPRRLKIYLSNGDIQLPSYMYFSNAFVMEDTYLGMIFSIGAIEVKGKHLGKFLDALQDERIRLLRYFDPDEYELPAVGEPLIESIRMLREDNRDEKS